MSLALYASPINNDEPINNSMNNMNNNIDKKHAALLLCSIQERTGHVNSPVTQID